MNNFTTIAGRRSAPFALAALCLVLCVCASFNEKAFAEDKPAGSASPEDPSGYVLRQHFDEYVVTGNDAIAISRSLNSQGPLGSDGKRYGGYTRWNIHWEYVSSGDRSGDCAIVSFHTVLDVEMTLPHWVPSAEVAASVRQPWSNYLTALHEHEDGHVQNAKMAALAIEHLMQTMEPQSDCDLLDKNLQSAGQQILQRFKDNDVDHDQRTGHGRTQGAVFP